MENIITAQLPACVDYLISLPDDSLKSELKNNAQTILDWMAISSGGGLQLKRLLDNFGSRKTGVQLIMIKQLTDARVKREINIPGAIRLRFKLARASACNLARARN